jgi:hypothetical protein
MKEGDTNYSSINPIKPSIELRRNLVSTTKRISQKEVLNMDGNSSPRRGFPPPFL